jgi:hypothetical protein
MISWFERRNGISWAVTILIGAAIFYISSLSFAYGPAVVGGSLNSMLYHLSAFFFFAFFLAITLTKGKNKKMIVLAVVLAVVYGISDELHQFFVPGRCMALSDVFLDTTGIVFAAMLYLVIGEGRK